MKLTVEIPDEQAAVVTARVGDLTAWVQTYVSNTAKKLADQTVEEKIQKMTITEKAQAVALWEAQK